MHCDNCGNKLDSLDKFCIKCGAPRPVHKPQISTVSDEKWWYRLLKVAYILLYLPLPLALVIAWSLNTSSYDYYTNTYSDTSGQALWYSFLTLVIYMAIVRLIKIATLYVAMGKKPEWREEFFKLF